MNGWANWYDGTYLPADVAPAHNSDHTAGLLDREAVLRVGGEGGGAGLVAAAARGGAAGGPLAGVAVRLPVQAGDIGELLALEDLAGG